MKHLLTLTLFISLISFAGENTSSKILGGPSLVDKSMNPAISLNGLFLGQYGTLIEHPGLSIQEVEAQFTAAVDPYFMGNFIVTAEQGGSLEVEEAYFSTLSIPRITLKGGKFLAAFGKNNTVHTHAQPLIDKPLVNKTLLGDEGFNSVGLEASVLAPTPWFLEITAAALSANDRFPATPFKTTNAEPVAGVFRLENLFDLSDVTTLSVGGSYTIGEGQIQKKNVSLFGADMTLKYVSGKGKGDFAISWINEYMQSKRPEYLTLATPDWEEAKGFYSTLLVRVSQRFWAGGRVDYIKIADTDISTVADNLMIAYVPSEFSAIRLQGGLSKTTNEDSKWQMLLQYNMTIGSHPAHAY